METGIKHGKRIKHGKGDKKTWKRDKKDNGRDETSFKHAVLHQHIAEGVQH